MASIKHKVTTEGSDCVHLSAMKKEYMDKILTWSMTTCPELKSVLHFISLVLTRMASASSWHGISNDMKKCFELVKLKWEDIQITDVTMVNHVLTKYLRGKQDTLAANKRDVYYEIHLRNQKGWQKKVDKGFREIDLQNLTSCNSFFWLMVWVRWLEHVHLGQAMVDGDFIFPVIGANGVVKPYELHCYENNHSNALGPFPCEVDMSLAGEHTLAAPATREDLWLLQSSAILGNVTNSLQDLTQVICLSQVLSTTAGSLPPPSGTHSAPSFGSIIVVPLLLVPGIFTTEHAAILVNLQCSAICSSSALVILVLSTNHINQHSWKDIIQHWEKGVPEKQLPLLRDWLYEFTHGPNHNLQSKYNQWHVIALEFLNQYKGDKKKFIEAYESAIQKGITILLHTITAACQKQDSPIVDRQYFRANLFILFATYVRQITPNHKTVWDGDALM
ncbi:hypothetical protein J3A83DRAFT_4186233 [Scleroderma citrinum]